MSVDMRVARLSSLAVYADPRRHPEELAAASRLWHNAGRPVTTRPEWRSAAIEGIAPLMSPREVEAALNHRGYVQVPCPTNGKLLDRPLYVGDERSCYRAPTARMAVSLYFLDSRRDGGWRW
jgi:hypothetical protein